MDLNYASFINAIFSALGVRYGKAKLHNQLMTIIEDVYITEFGYIGLGVTTTSASQISGLYNGERDIKQEIKDLWSRVTNIASISEEIQTTVLSALPHKNEPSLRRGITRIIQEDESVENINDTDRAAFLESAQDMQLADLVAAVFLHVVKYTKNTPYVPEGDRQPETIRDECKKMMASQIDQYIRSGIYFEKHARDMTYYFDSNLKQFSKKVFTSAVLINPFAEEDIHYSMNVMMRPKLFSPGNEIAYIRNNLRSGLKVTVNKVSLKDYLVQLGTKYPEQYGGYATIQEDDSWDVYSLYSIEDRDDAAAFVENKKMTFQFPLDKDIERHEINTEYVTRGNLQIGRTGTVFRITYPCKHLDHKYILRFKNPEAWEIAFYVFEPFYLIANAVNPMKEKSFSIDRNDRQSVSLVMDSLILPGTGYVNRVILREAIDGDSLTQEFLNQSKLLDDEDF